MERLVRFAGCRLTALLAVCVAATVVASDRSARLGECTPASSAPKLDGKLDDECWKSAAVMTDFLLDSGRGGLQPPSRCAKGRSSRAACTCKRKMSGSARDPGRCSV